MVHRAIFVPARGQYDNIGDILLRRQLLDWLRESGPLHVYVGHSPDGYDQGLRLKPDDTVYRSFAKWYSAGLARAVRGGASYVFKPGEIQLTLVGMKEHLSMLPLVALARLTGGFVGRIGVGSRNFARGPRALMMPSILLSNVSWWRDARTARYLRRGSVIPDLAFGEAADESATVRDLLVVSMREDEAHIGAPTAEWKDGLRRFASAHDLRIVTVVQVHRDQARAVELAADLGGQAIGWNGSDHQAQEEVLRGTYRRALVTVSDRLHVLIAAATEGSVPAAPLVRNSDKIARHFAEAGVHDIAFATSSAGAEQIAGQLEEILARRESILAAVAGARGRLEDARERLRDLMLAGPRR